MKERFSLPYVPGTEASAAAEETRLTVLLTRGISAHEYRQYGLSRIVDHYRRQQLLLPAERARYTPLFFCIYHWSSPHVQEEIALRREAKSGLGAYVVKRRAMVGGRPPQKGVHIPRKPLQEGSI